jgi:hypothetical protein
MQAMMLELGGFSDFLEWPVLFRRSGRISKARLSADLSRAGPRRAKSKKRGARGVPRPFFTRVASS